MVLAANATTWDDLYLTALTQAGIIRPVDEPPQVAEDPLVDSMEAVLAAGILAGPAGNQITTNGNLSQFFADVRTWYGNDPTQNSPYIGTGTDRGPTATSQLSIRGQSAAGQPVQPQRVGADAIRGLRRLCALHERYGCYLRIRRIPAYMNPPRP